MGVQENARPVMVIEMASKDGFSRFLLPITLILSGSMNTLCKKYANLQWSLNSIGILRPFHHPYLQLLAMFLAETFLLAIVCVRRWNQRQNQYDQLSNAEKDPLLADGSKEKARNGK